MYKFFLKTFLIFCLSASPLLSKNYKEILINGNKRISNGTIMVFSDIKKDIDIDENSLNLILKNLYKTGFFKTVSVKLENNLLIIDVSENPIIQSVIIKGLKTVKLTESIKESLILRDRSSFNKVSAKADELSILDILKKNGYYFSTLKSFTEDISDNRINLTYEINTGNKAKIKKISFIGDKYFKDSKLINVIVSEEYKFWKFLSGKKFLNESLIYFDTQLLENFYKNKGFYNIKIESSFANYLGRDQFEIIYNISSGKKFLFNVLSLNLPLDYDLEHFSDLKGIFKKLKNENYSLSTIDKILKEIDKITLNEQYEFLTATVEEEINGNLINLVFNIKESEKFYVERVNIFGNNVTQEEFIRNQLIVDEGDPFNVLLHNKSLNNLKSKGIFGSAESKIRDGSENGQKIIDITITEKPTGEISAGAGYGSSGSTLSFGIKENNFNGKGINLNTNLSITEESIKGMLAYTHPNFAYSDRSLTTSLQSTVTDKEKDYGYKSSLNSISLGTGYEQYKDLYFYPSISIAGESLTTTANASANYKKQEGSYFDTLFNYSITYDKRNSRYQPTDGFKSTWLQNLPILADNSTILNGYDITSYKEIIDDMVFTAGFYSRAINSIGDKDVRVSKRLFIPNTKLHGFEPGKVGPKDGTDYVGGNYITTFNTSTTVPYLLQTLETVDLKLFFDAANVWGVDYSSSVDDSNKIRSAFGAVVEVLTPIGPLSFSLSQPITKAAGDKTETFRFQLGTTF